MTMQTDEMDKLLYEKIGACRDRWLESQPEQCEPHHFSEAFLAGLLEIGNHGRRSLWKGLRISVLCDAILGALAAIFGTEYLSPVRNFRGSTVNGFAQLSTKSMDQTYTTNTAREGEIKRPVLGWLPEGMAEIRRSEQPEYTNLNFESSSKEWITISVRCITENSGNTSVFDTEDAQINEIKINGATATISIKEEMAVLIYFIDNHRCSISGSISADNLIKIAENMILK